MKLYFARIFTCEDTRLFDTYEKAEKQLESHIRRIYGRLPQYHDGMDVDSKDFDENEIIDMRDNEILGNMHVYHDFFVKR